MHLRKLHLPPHVLAAALADNRAAAAASPDDGRPQVRRIGGVFAFEDDDAGLTGLIASLVKHDATKVVDALQSGFHKAYQMAFDRGHSKATADAKAETKRLTDEAAAQKKRADDAEAALETERAKAPEVATLRDQHKAEIARIRAEHKAETDKLRGDLRERDRGAALGKARTLLVDKLGVDPDYADVLLAKPDVRERIHVKDDGTVEIHQKGKTIPIDAKDGNLHEVFAKELHADVPAKFRTASGDSGSGVGGGGGTGGKTGNGSGYDPKAEGKQMAERTRPPADAVAGALR